MILSHRIELDATSKQREYFMQACGTARLVWNLALAEWDRQYAAGEKPSGMSLRKEFNQTKYQRFPWLKNIHRDAHSQPFTNLQKAFVAFFKGVAKRPIFKKKGKSKDSFYVANDKIHVDGKSVTLTKIGRVRTTESLRFDGKIMSAVVSRTADRWFISIQVDVGDYTRQRTGNEVVGVDLGAKVSATLSTGEQLQGPRPLKIALKRLARTSRELSRRKVGSKNRHKTKMKLAKLHARISRIRKDWLNKSTTRLCRENQAVAIESLHVAGMIRNRRLARAISDIGFGEFSRQMRYKSQIYGCQLVVADRWFPSSKTCSCCGSIKADLALKDRVYKCTACGLRIDRDVNAALNLRTLGLRGIACGSLDNPGESNFAGAERVEAGTKLCLPVSTA